LPKRQASGEAGFLPKPPIELGQLCLDTNCCRASWNGQDVGLPLGEYGIVHLLVSSLGNYVTYRSLYDRLLSKGFMAGYGANGYWGNVRSVIRRIRKKICACDPAFDEIETTPASDTTAGESLTWLNHETATLWTAFTFDPHRTGAPLCSTSPRRCTSQQSKLAGAVCLFRPSLVLSQTSPTAS